jgi:serine/threonine-protein kinase
MNDTGLPRGIGRYRPIALLGSGGMGTVYRAHDPLIDRVVAIKVVHTDALDADTRTEYLERFRLEAQAAGRCTHPGIVAVYDFSGAGGEPYIVMELVEGRSLREILLEPASRTALPVGTMLMQVLDALGYAHARGIIHRDMKPGNIIVTGSGQAKIADFGIARLSDGTKGDATLTQAGALLGTPNYMAPEQVGSDTVDHRADLFAIGAILYQILTGRPPFAGRNAGETMRRLCGAESASMVAVEAADRGAFVPVLRRALAKQPDERFQSAEDFAAALAEAGSLRRPAASVPDDPQATLVWGGARAPSTVTRSWDPVLLARVERALAQYAGPMARVIVAQAAQQSATADDLYQVIARGLQTAADRSGFLRSVGGARIEPTLGQHARTVQTQAPPTSFVTAAPEAAELVPPAAITAAQTVLTFFVGPIARVLVRDAAKQVASRQEFLDRLCAHVTRPDELVALRRRLRAEVEPALR